MEQLLRTHTKLFFYKNGHTRRRVNVESHIYNRHFQNFQEKQKTNILSLISELKKISLYILSNFCIIIGNFLFKFLFYVN